MLILLEFKKMKRTRVLYIVVVTMALFSLCALAEGVRLRTPANNLVSDALAYSTYLIVPPLYALLGSFMISREYVENTMKSLLIVPVDPRKLLAAKLAACLGIGLGLHLVLFLFTLVAALIVHPEQVGAGFIFSNLGVYLLQGIGCWVVVTPLFLFMATVKNGAWLSILLAEAYSFCGLFAASSRFRFIFPISAVFGFSGAFPTTFGQYLSCVVSLIVCGLVSVALVQVEHIFRWNVKRL
jgi:ABC-type transport system involved in multi-copper enzyme maturation permease subunit